MSGARVQHDGRGRIVKFRDPTRNPKDPRCALAFRRVCGVCPHFAGHLRQGKPDLCRKLGAMVGPTRDAGGCEYWSRPVAGAAP